jgi:hypothetical protein
MSSVLDVIVAKPGDFLRGQREIRPETRLERCEH